MQQTRLNNLFNLATNRVERLFTNPWRRIALVLISLLLGIFMGSAIVTTAGQDAEWDVFGAVLLFLFTEAVSKIVYSRRKRPKTIDWKSLSLDVLNAFKIGLTYSLFLEAFKLGS